MKHQIAMPDAAPPHAPPAIEPSGAARYWRTARWLTALPALFTIAQIVIQFRLNLWSHAFCNAFERRDGATLQTEALLFIGFAGLSISVAGMTP